jgi:hypothetical protein
METLAVNHKPNGKFAPGHSLGKRFTKGWSGGPGRKSVVKIIRDNARHESQYAVQWLLDIATDRKQDVGDRLRAMEQILAWAWGKPDQKRVNNAREQLNGQTD